MIDSTVEIAITFLLLLGVILLFAVLIGLVWMLEGPPRGWEQWRASRDDLGNEDTDPGTGATWNAAND